MHRPRGPLTLHLVLAAVALTLTGWSAMRSALIAKPVNGRVRSVAWAEEGPDYRVIELDDGRVITVDSVLWRRLGGDDLVGDRLEVKGAVAHVDGRHLRLSVSAASWRALVVMVVLLVLGTARSRRGRVSRSPRYASPLIGHRDQSNSR